ncbi:MAG: endolytic transglycosylase MltG [Pigmentiphaga sp.]|nr:endolytic transglycosylase MltG [Pigmentiphaga sp.]
MLGFVVRALVLVAIVAALAVAAAVYWALRPLSLPHDPLDFSIAPGTSLRGIARDLQKEGLDVHPEAFVLMARFSGLDRQIKAGSYEVTSRDNLWQLLNRMAQGDVQYARITFIEGWTYRQMRAELAKHPDIRSVLEGVDDAELLKRLGAEAKHPEGLFFPDTYSFAKGSSDFDILRRAHAAQRQRLDEAWKARDPDTPWRTPYEMLIMASIVEKETGDSADRGRVAGVFANRLKVGMPLQTDPTVIYGMGDAYDGRLLRRHLQIDHPWNTYTRPGLPPTPIANPGRAALDAAARPEEHRYYYFVSRGDGTSAFSQNLAQHNREVNRYIRGARQP